MKSTSRFLPFLVFVTLFVMGEVWGSGSNALGSKSQTSGSASSGRSSSSGSSSAGNGHRQTQTTPASPSTSSTRVPNHRATITPPGIQTSSASVENCVDDKSPAESCFDYFTLAVLWTPGYAYKQSLNGHRAHDRTLARWVIHGLWPSMYSKDAIIPPRCNRTDIYYNTHQFNKNKLRQKLETNWYSVLQSGFNTNDKFWEHEFIKHGDCSTRSTAINDTFGYFSKTYELFENLQISTKLSNARYRPGTTAKLRDIIKIIEESVHKKVKVDYATDTTKQTADNEYNNYLAEVFVCYNTGLTAIIDCPNSSRPNSVLDKKVIYLDQMLRPGQQDDKNRRGAATSRRGRARRALSSYYLGLNSSDLTN